MNRKSSNQSTAQRKAKLGDAAKDRGDLARARTHYQSALRLVPDLPSAMSGLAAVEGREGNFAAAEALLKAVIASSAPSARRAGASIALANGLDSLGRWDEAFSIYASVLTISITETYPGERNWLLADAYCGMGEVEARRENITAAAELYTSALKQAPNHAPSLANLAICYEQMNRPAAAIHALTAALHLEPKQGDWWLILGDMYRDAGKPHLARPCYRNAINLGEEAAAEALADLPPETSAQWYESGREYEVAGDAAGAANCFRRALALGNKRAAADVRRLEEEQHP